MFKNWQVWATVLGLGLALFVGGWGGKWAYNANNQPTPDSTVWFIRVGVVVMVVGILGVFACLIHDYRADPQRRRRRDAPNPPSAADMRVRQISTLTVFMGEGFNLKDEIRGLVDKWDEKYADRARDWEQRVLTYLHGELPAYSGTFRLDNVVQQWQPGACLEVATWGNFMDRRLAAIDRIVTDLRSLAATSAQVLPPSLPPRKRSEVISDGIRWRHTGQTSYSGQPGMEPLCPEAGFAIEIMLKSPYAGELKAISNSDMHLLGVHVSGYGPYRLWCPGLHEHEGHEIELERSHTWAEAESVAARKLKAQIEIDRATQQGKHGG